MHKLGALVTVTEDPDKIIGDLIKLDRILDSLHQIVFKGPCAADCVLFRPIYEVLKKRPELKCLVYVDEEFDRLFDDDVIDIYDEFGEQIELHINPTKMTWANGSLRKDLKRLKGALKTGRSSISFGSYSDFELKAWKAIYFDLPIKHFVEYHDRFDMEQFVIDMENYRAELYNLQYEADIQFGGNEIEKLIIVEEDMFYSVDLGSWSHPAMITTDIDKIHMRLIDGYFSNITHKRLGTCTTDSHNREVQSEV